MIAQIRFADAPLAAMLSDDPSHSGEFSSRYATVFQSADGALQVGFEELSGDITAAPADGFEEIVVVLEGTAEIERGDQTFHVGSGDVVVQDHPIGAKSVLTAGLKTAYVIHRRR
jgi:uncharacterized cupin superfamily protein